MMRKLKKKPLTLKGTKKRTCQCGATFRYNGKGRPFARCPKCR